MARQFAAAADDVTWFNGTFDHVSRRSRYTCTTTVDVDARIRIVGLHGIPYRRNVSLTRIRHHRQVASEFLRVAPTMGKPDIIVASMPPLELSAAAMTLGTQWKVPVVMDVRDLWPEIFLEAVPKWTRWLAKPALSTFYRLLRISVDGSAAVVGVSDDAVSWALGHGTRSRTTLDGNLPMAYAPPVLSETALSDAERFWNSLGVRVGGPFTATFIGTFSRRVDVDTVAAAARRLAKRQRRIQIVLAGRGEREAELREATVGLDNVVMPGWLDAPRIAVLLSRSQVGLLPYPNVLDFTRSIPNKVFDYVGGGVPIVTSLGGVTAGALQAHRCGWTYSGRDDEGLAELLCRLEAQPDQVYAAAAGARELATEFDPAMVYGAFREKLQILVADSAAKRYAS